MAFWNKKELREAPTVAPSSENFFQFFGIDTSTSGVFVSIDNALGVPAIWAAVQFMSGTLAGLPLHVYRSTTSGKKKITDKVSAILNDVANDEMSSFEWRKYILEQVFTGGRGISFIERNGLGQIINIWPLDPTCVTVERRAGKKVYKYTTGQVTTPYMANEILDIPFMLKTDMLAHRGPIMTNKEVVAKAIAMTRYTSKIFENGGVPAFTVTGPFGSAAAADRASADLTAAVLKASKENRAALAVPVGHELKQIGIEPQKMQLTDTQRFAIEEIARIYSLPPVFLQDLTHGTFSNTEQQDLQLVKHTLKRWVEQIEAEINLKIFGRGSKLYAKFNVDGLLRGDIKTRYEAYGSAIQNGFKTPDEVRQLEDDETKGGNADKLFIQGATVPLDTQTGIMGDTNNV
jgi:HK97 family phage portal protein